MTAIIKVTRSAVNWPRIYQHWINQPGLSNKYEQDIDDASCNGVEVGGENEAYGIKVAYMRHELASTQPVIMVSIVQMNTNQPSS